VPFRFHRPLDRLHGRTATAALVACVFAWLAATAWVRPLALPDEGRYVGVALEMLWSGDWVVPTLDTLPYFHKPPLFYWLTGGSLALFGVHEWVARVASLLAATGAALALYLFTRRWLGETRARLSLLILATTPFFFGGAQFANLDPLVMSCIACTILSAADAILAAKDNRPRRATLAAAYAFAAFGVLAKGLIGVVIPGLVIGAWLLAGRRAAIIPRLIWLPGLALFAVIAVPWFALVEMRYPGFMRYFFVHHHLERFTTGAFNGHEPFWFYVPVFAVAALPWSFFLIRAALPGRTPVDRATANIGLLMWLWLVITLVFFSIPESKLLGYVLTAVPPFAVLAALGVERFASSRGGAWRWARGIAVVGGSLCLAVLAIAASRDRDSVATVAKTLRPLLASPDATVVTFRTFPFSLPFYLQHRPPLPVALDWNDPTVFQRDNWRKELREAAAFAPQRSGAVLFSLQHLSYLLACSPGTVYVVAQDADSHAEPAPGLQRVGAGGRYVIWRSTPAAAPAAECGP
jgi:4-amino-4-deoxy-L-arabinose transferase-like glycosyltransferase